jgi:large subunit ribosomal protein L3
VVSWIADFLGKEPAMTLGLLARKVGMTQIFNDRGQAEPVTVLEAGPCPVMQVRTSERDGYHAVQLGLVDKSRARSTRAERGHVSSELVSRRRERLKLAGQLGTLPPKAECEPQRYVREFRLETAATVTVGARLVVGDVFKDVKAVDVIGTTKGRGYTGVMKRWNFAGLPAAHGAKKVHRSVGSTSSLAANRGFGRPKKGKKMPGQYGNEQVTIRNLTIVQIDEANNLILVRGAVPGANGGLVLVRPTNKIKR